MLLTFGADLQYLVVQAKQVGLAMETAFSVFVVELEGVIRLGVVLRLTLLKSELQNIVVFRTSDPFLGLLLRWLHHDPPLFWLRLIQPFGETDAFGLE